MFPKEGTKRASGQTEDVLAPAWGPGQLAVTVTVLKCTRGS